jgi:hypothetical protein
MPDYSIVAIDPGVNFGMTTISDGDVWIYNGKLKQCKTSLEYSWEAFGLISSVLYMVSRLNVRVVIEGAAYNKTFGQVGLADVRAGFYLGAREVLGSPDNIYIVAPMTVRKKVFGDGRYQAGDAFPLLNHNAADSVGIAFWAMDASLRPEAQGS